MSYPKTTPDIKRVLFKYHLAEGYKLFDSFPLLSEDPTVLLTNASITPFKRLFTDPTITPQNFALIQRCFRAGGSNSLEAVGTNPSFHTFFEMFGSGTFNINHTLAVSYLLTLLDNLGLDKTKLNFTIPPDEDFRKALRNNNVEKEKIHVITENGIFWCYWKFGKGGPLGRGLTVVYSIKGENPCSAEQMAQNQEAFLELLNLIYIYGQEGENGSVMPVVHPGFELGMGVGRLASILQEKNGYQIDTFLPLVQLVELFFQTHSYSNTTARIYVCADHLDGVCVLLNEKIIPGNKGSSYVLRKLIRRLLENVWIAAGYPATIEELVAQYAELLRVLDPVFRIPTTEVVSAIQQEHSLLLGVLKNGISLLEKKPNLDLSVLRDTYGLSPELLTIAKNGGI